MQTADAIKILAGRSGRTESEIREILDGVNSLRRRGEPEFRPLRHTTMVDCAEVLYESDDGVVLSVWTPRKSEFEWGEAEFAYFLKEEGEDAEPCNSWADALARRNFDPEPQPLPPPRGLNPKLVVNRK